MKKLLLQFWNDQSGATAIEYGIIAALPSIGIVGSAMTVGGGIKVRFEQVSTYVAQ